MVFGTRVCRYIDVTPCLIVFCTHSSHAVGMIFKKNVFLICLLFGLGISTHQRCWSSFLVSQFDYVVLKHLPYISMRFYVNIEFVRIKFKCYYWSLSMISYHSWWAEQALFIRQVGISTCPFSYSLTVCAGSFGITTTQHEWSSIAHRARNCL